MAESGQTALNSATESVTEGKVTQIVIRCQGLITRVALNRCLCKQVLESNQPVNVRAHSTVPRLGTQEEMSENNIVVCINVDGNVRNAAAESHSARFMAISGNAGIQPNKERALAESNKKVTADAEAVVLHILFEFALGNYGKEVDTQLKLLGMRTRGCSKSKKDE